VTSSLVLPFGREEVSVADWPFALERLEPPEASPGAWRSAAEAASLAADGIAPAVSGGRVAVAVPDRTRPFPRRALLGLLLDALAVRGIASDRVDLVVARGLHRGDAPSEMADLPAQVHLHDARTSELVDLGHAGSVPVRLNAVWVRASARLSLGTAAFHYLAGFGGGRKTVAPGLAGEETIVAIHLGAVGADGRRHPGVGCGRLEGNPVHGRARGAALAAPATVAVEAVGDPRRPGFLVGSWDEVHRAGARWVAQAHSVPVPEPRRLVVASVGGHPRDRDLIQSHKALEHLRPAVRPGGSVVLFAACDDGLGHPDLLAYGSLGAARTVARALRDRFAVYGQTAWALREKAELLDLVLVSRLPADTVRALGLRPAPTADDALAAVREVLPEGEPGWLLPRAGTHVATPTA
jgi:hypothetical protein